MRTLKDLSEPIPLAARSKGVSLPLLVAGIVDSNPTRGMSVMIVVFCQVEVSASDRSLLQRSPSECDVPEPQLV